MILESFILIKCGGILSFILIKCADVVVLVRVSVAAVAAGCGSAGAAWTQGLMSTAAQVRARLGILRSVQDAGRAVTMQSSSEEKIRLFRAMFCGREDVFISTAYYKIGGGWKYRIARTLTRPPWRFRSTDLDDSVYRLGVPRSTDLGFSVDRPGDFGGPTLPIGLTDFADSVDRVYQPPGGLPIPR